MVGKIVMGYSIHFDLDEPFLIGAKEGGKLKAFLESLSDEDREFFNCLHRLALELAINEMLRLIAERG